MTATAQPQPSLALEPRAESLRVCRRTIDEGIQRQAEAAGLHPIAAQILASRGLPATVDIDAFLNPTLRALDPPMLLADMEAAANRLATAIIGQEIIGIQTDYDTDGLGAHAAFVTVLTDVFRHPADRLLSFVGNRLTEGYGLTDPVADRILASPQSPAILITADNGSSDEPRIRRLAEAGIDVVVTDHHIIPAEGPPASAYACVNPQRDDCRYPDKAIAGGMVIWLLLAATRRVLVDAEYLSDQATRGLASVLDYVACSTVADCVSVASLNNRAVINHGLGLIENQDKPCWSGMRRFLGEGPVDAQSIAFQIAPRIHSRTRLADPMAALKFLLSATQKEAKGWADRLDQDNQERKRIEAGILEMALTAATQRVEAGRYSITLFLEDAHPGVQGICSSRVVERFGRPALLFSPTATDPDLLTGSARSIDAFHFREALQTVEDNHPGLMQRFGGHRAAAGVSIRRERFLEFEKALETATRLQLIASDVGPQILTDGELPASEIALSTVDAIRVLAPFGRGFDAPLFEGSFQVIDVRPIGDKTHLRLTLIADGVSVPAVWFRARSNDSEPLPCQIGDNIRCCFVLDDNIYRRKRSLQAKIVTLLEAA